MAEEREATSATSATSAKSDSNKKKTNPPEGYLCNLCGVPGHWIQQCSSANKNHRKNKKRKSSGHEYQEGVDPSSKDIERAKKMQQIEPPLCDCGIKSRLKKVKRSKVTENSRAVGSYFFFCSKKKEDSTKCNFAQPVEEMQKSKKEKVQSNFFAKKRKEL